MGLRGIGRSRRCRRLYRCLRRLSEEWAGEQRAIRTWTTPWLCSKPSNKDKDKDKNKAETRLASLAVYTRIEALRATVEVVVAVPQLESLERHVRRVAARTRLA